METRLDLVLELSREPFKIDQICQLQKCVPRWEEQSINRVFHSRMPGSWVIVADITKAVEEWKPAWTLYLNYLENHKIDQICQLQKCVPRWEEQSINRVFHSRMPGSRVFSGWYNKSCRGMETRWDLYLNYLENHLDRSNMSIQKCVPRWEEQSINRVFHSRMPGSWVTVADIT